MPQLKVLFVVDWLGPVSMSQLAARLHLSVSAATGLVDRIVEHGLAQREADSRDRRVVRVASTAEGQALVLRLHSAGSERLGRILDRLTSDELERCLVAMELVNNAVEAESQTELAVMNHQAVAASSEG